MSTHTPTPTHLVAPADKRIAIVAARFNEHVVSKLLAGCEQRLAELGVARTQYAIFRVPGAFELPVAALQAVEVGGYDAVICLGCIIRGETYHFEMVANQAAAGIQEVSLRTRKPVIFGVLTVNTQEQADARTGGSHGHAGISAAEAAIEMLYTVGQMK